jgi:hypothetical protein
LRQYHYQATDSTLEALRLLRGAWSRIHVADTAVTVVLSDGRAVCLQVEAADVEDAFEAFRLTATVDPSPMVYGDAQPAFAEGGNDIVVFTGATWSESRAAVASPSLSPDSVLQFSGHPGQISESAEVVVLTSDAVVIASSSGVGLLIRTGLKPYSLDVVRDAEPVRAFLLERGYNSDG